jgi:hypothetical protein
MTIPKKGSRKLTIDGKPFRYITKTLTKDEGTSTMLTVQEDCFEPGNVLQVDFDAIRLVFESPVASMNLLETNRGCFGIGPGDIVKIVQASHQSRLEPFTKRSGGDVARNNQPEKDLT